MDEYVLPRLEELIEKVRKMVSDPSDPCKNALRWREYNREGYERALREICARVLELRREGEPERVSEQTWVDPCGINEIVGRQERKPGDDVMGRWDLTGCAIILTRPPKRPRGRPKALKEYPIEEIRRMKEEGLSVREIAAKTGIPKSTVHRLLSRPEK